MFRRLLNLLCSLRFLPHLFVYYSSARSLRALLDYERDRWLEKNGFSQTGVRGFLRLLNMFPEYRSLFYHRTGKQNLSIFAVGQANLHFHTPSEKIGKGLVIWHGYSTVINAVSVGEDCEIWHLVTVGKKHTKPDELDKPIIGDNVKVCTGAICVGAIEIAQGSVVAAGAVVNQNVPERSLAYGVPAKIRVKCI